MNTVGTTKLNSMYSYRSLGTQGAYDNAQTLAHDIAAYGFNTGLCARGRCLDE